MTAAALAGIGWYLLARRPKARLEYISLLLIWAGGIGNLIDRVLHGTVVDFFAVTFTNFAVFNVADCYVTVGVCLLLLFYIIKEVRDAKQKKAAGNDKP